MVEMTEMGFRRIHILLFSVLGLTFAALPLAAQQPPVEARIAGLEGNEEYMSLLREDAVLQSRVDSVVRAVEQVRLRLREHPTNARPVPRRFCGWRAGSSISGMPRAG